MEIRSEPYNLRINNIDISECPCCNNGLKKEIKKGNYLINGECGYCRYSERSFVSYSSSWQQHYPDGCICKNGEKNYKRQY